MEAVENRIKAPRIRMQKKSRRIAYFSMEVGINSKMPTYSGGLGVLAADTIHSCADLNVPIVAVTLLYKKGYFNQVLDQHGQQSESPYQWKPRTFLRLLPKKIIVKIENRDVHVQAWRYNVKGASGYYVPLIFLDTDLPENSEFDRALSHYLYGGDERYRFAQEMILGIGGVRMLKALNFNQIKRYHMNEGHASLLTLELLCQKKIETEPDWDIESVRRACVFTTHTPVPAGHDHFSYDLAGSMLGDFIPMDVLKSFAGQENLNMTYLALNLSNYVNGVAKQHGAVSQDMFPEHRIDAITNGVHSFRWACESFKKLFDKYMPGWANDPFSLRYALNIPQDEIWDAHMEAKKKLINFVNERTKIKLDPDALTMGFARRATAYKRADLVFRDINRLTEICDKVGKVQFIFSGKAHPKDWQGKELIKKIFSASNELKDKARIAYLTNYDVDTAKMLVSGVDLWLNTPRKPQEASGTSGMKAAHNGIPSFSILDGWWIEGFLEGLTGWSIDSIDNKQSDDENDSRALYEKLEKVIAPMFYNNRRQWIDVMRYAIAINASFFNTHRMVQQYVLNAYL